MALVILEQEVVHVEINLHAVGMVEVPQRTAEQDTVKARDNPLYAVLKTRDKLLHGVPFVWVLKLDTSFNLHLGNARNPFAACRHTGSALLGGVALDPRKL